MFGSGDDAFVVELANLPLAETKNIQQNFVGMLTQPRSRLRWQPRNLAEVEGRGRHQICPDAGLFHHAEHWIVNGTVGVVFHGFPHRLIRAPCDTLFLEGCGRTDLPGSDADAMYESLQRLARLPEATIVYPGHRYSLPSSGTMDAVLATNIVYKPKSKDGWMMMFGQS